MKLRINLVKGKPSSRGFFLREISSFAYDFLESDRVRIIVSDDGKHKKKTKQHKLDLGVKQ